MLRLPLLFIRLSKSTCLLGLAIVLGLSFVKSAFAEQGRVASGSLEDTEPFLVLPLILRASPLGQGAGLIVPAPKPGQIFSAKI